VEGSTGSGTVESDSAPPEGQVNQTLAAALALIAELPLTKQEKAEAVRRLLGQAEGKQ
jgi:hypothetical protein